MKDSPENNALTIARSAERQFSVLLHNYLLKANGGHDFQPSDFQNLASRLNIPSVTAETLLHLEQGKTFPTMQVAKALADALNIIDRATSLNGVHSSKHSSKPRKEFTDSAYIAMESQPLQQILDAYAAQNNIISQRRLADNLGISEMKIRVIYKNGTFSSKQVASACANKLGLHEEHKERFVKKFGNFHLSDEQTLEELQSGQITLAKALKSLIQIRGTQIKEFFDDINIPSTQYLSWMQDNDAATPPPKMMVRLTKPDAFDLDRESAEILCLAAGCFLDKQHITDSLRQNKINIGDAIKAIIALDYDSQRAFATAKKINPGTVTRWMHGEIPRAPLMELINDLSDEDKKLYLEKSGFWFDGADVIAAFQNEGNHNQFISTVKAKFGLTDADFNVTADSVRRHRRKEYKPTAKTMVAEFFALKDKIPNFDSCWETYKTVCARSERYAGNYESCKTLDLLFRQMEEERAKPGKGIH